MAAHSEPICILDDDPSVRDSIEQLLESDDLRARSFEDAEDFLSHARSHPEAFLSLVRQALAFAA